MSTERGVYGLYTKIDSEKSTHDASDDTNGRSMCNVIHCAMICSKCLNLPTLEERAACNHVEMLSWTSK
jgi:hypothetical protein